MTTPARIQNLRAVPGDGIINVTWDAFPGVDPTFAYDVEVIETQLNIHHGFVPRTPTQLSYRVANLDNGRRYTIVVTAKSDARGTIIARSSVEATPNGPVPTYPDGPTNISLSGHTLSWTNPTPPRGLSIVSTGVWVWSIPVDEYLRDVPSGESVVINTRRDESRPIYLRTYYSDGSRSDFVRFDPPQEIYAVPATIGPPAKEIYAVPARISGFEEIYQLNASIDAPFREIYAVPAIQTGLLEIYAVPATIGPPAKEIYAVPAFIPGFEEIYAVPAEIGAQFREIYRVNAFQGQSFRTFDLRILPMSDAIQWKSKFASGERFTPNYSFNSRAVTRADNVPAEIRYDGGPWEQTVLDHIEFITTRHRSNHAGTGIAISSGQETIIIKSGEVYNGPAAAASWWAVEPDGTTYGDPASPDESPATLQTQPNTCLLYTSPSPRDS